MIRKLRRTRLFEIEQCINLLFLCKWLFLGSIVGALAGSASAILLISLDQATDFRENNLWIIALLPIGGLISGLLYYHFGQRSEKGNNLLLEEYHHAEQTIPLRMAPLVLIGTIITHLFGGSAGREGTAVQMGGALSDQFGKWFKLNAHDRKIIIVMGISAGFASVFGTPLAGAIFALEVLVLGKIRYEAILPSFIAAVIGNYVCNLWPIDHSHYHIPFVPELTPTRLAWTAAAGILFGLAAMLFSKSTHGFGSLFKKHIGYAPARPLIGGAVLAIIIYFIGTTKYIGLGIPTIEASFVDSMNSYDFLIKIAFTAFTIGAGFKGGEVTPLFFIGATLGNAMVWLIPLPMPLLAGMGFVAVFAGATNTPIACTLMGIELFGADCGVYVAIACVVAYLFSGHTGIYSSQIIGAPKHRFYKKFKGLHLKDAKH
ncbi:voltage-gated chloride channel family protein [Verrucomicrobiaceae bacterium N1E253]|uniref:Voltage-gated chloride channel family protein n=1 Tax=Oceaniferula marina TaxID=2748318 RepID=A0A851GHP8_9BACT|nr:voltage-gated chloride channel family protein [Oceaniferula marina]NWK57053.1 voltage-gated chloride channel family protein [Oceaniferula marina]